MPEVAEAIREDCAAMPPVLAEWPLEVHDRLVSKFFRLVWARHAAGVPALPRKPWVTPELAPRLLAHASARRLCSNSGRALRLARLRVVFLLRGLFARALAPVLCGLVLALAGALLLLFTLCRFPRLPPRVLVRFLLGRNSGS